MTSKLILAAAMVAASCASAGGATPIAILNPGGLQTNEYFGYSVSTDGQRVLIGTGTNTAFLYDPFTQQQLAKLTILQGGFGTSVALQGNIGVVGNGVGAFVFDFSNLANVTSIPLTSAGNPLPLIGYSVDLSGDVIIAGAAGDATFGQFSGAAYLFDRTTGASFAKLTANDAQQYDNFGISVAIDDGRAIVGSVMGGPNNTGAVYLFNAEPGFAGNRQLDRYDQPAPPSQTQFAYNADINGQTIVATEAFGKSYHWSIGNAPTPLPNSSFNNRVTADGISVSDDYVALGFEEHGLVRIYDKAGTLLRNLTPPPGSPIGFGLSVAIEGDLLVVGAGGVSPFASKAFVYRVQDVLVPEPYGLAVASIGCIAVAFLRAGIGNLHLMRRQGETTTSTETTVEKSGENPPPAN